MEMTHKLTKDIRRTFDEFLSIDIVFNIGKQEEASHTNLSDIIVNHLWDKIETLDIEILLNNLGLNDDDIFVISPERIFSNNLDLPLILKNLGYQNVKTYNGYSDSEDLIEIEQKNK